MDLNVKHKIIKSLEKKRKQSLGYKGRQSILTLDTKSIIHNIKIDKLGHIKIRNVSPVRDPVKKMKVQAKDWEKIFSND